MKFRLQSREFQIADQKQIQRRLSLGVTMSRKPVLLALLGVACMNENLPTDDRALRQAVTFYASFDEKPEADFGQGDRKLWTRADDLAEKGKKVIRPGFDATRIRIVAGGGRSGGALGIRELSPDNAYVFFRAKGNVAVKKGGWGGSISLWVKADLAKIPAKGPWDPFLLVEKGWNSGAVWCDFAPGESPRDLRIGLFPTVPESQTPPTLEEGEKIWRVVKAPRFQTGTWHHIVQVWDNFDTGRPDGRTACYLDGKLQGEITGRTATMNWDLDHVRLHVGSALVGFLDEVALFDRPLSETEIQRLYQASDLLKELKK